MRFHPAEIAATQIAAEPGDGEIGKAMAEQHAECRPHHADDGAFDDKLRHQRAAPQAEHAQQRELWPPPRHCQRLRRIDEKAAGEQRHHRQHFEVDAIGARHGIAALCLLRGARQRRIGGQQFGDARLDRVAIGAIRQFYVEALQPPQLPEAPLCRGDIEHRQRLGGIGTGDDPGDDELSPLPGRDQRHRATDAGIEQVHRGA
jgi:hypothetical protein